MSDEPTRSEDGVQKTEARRIERENQEKVTSLVSGAALPSDPGERIMAVRHEITRARNMGHGIVDRKEQRDMIQKWTKELLKAEGEFVAYEIEKARKVGEYEHKAWLVKLNDAWMEFLKKTGVEATVKRENFAIEWMECCNGKREEIEHRRLTPQQKKRVMDMVDKDEDAMIGEVEQMAEKIIKIAQSQSESAK